MRPKLTGRYIWADAAQRALEGRSGRGERDSTFSWKDCRSTKYSAAHDPPSAIHPITQVDVSFLLP